MKIESEENPFASLMVDVLIMLPLSFGLMVWLIGWPSQIFEWGWYWSAVGLIIFRSVQKVISP